MKSSSKKYYTTCIECLDNHVELDYTVYPKISLAIIGTVVTLQDCLSCFIVTDKYLFNIIIFPSTIQIHSTGYTKWLFRFVKLTSLGVK